jgi:hypothetical protein
MSQEVHARFKRLLRVRGLAPDDQDLAVELHEDVAHDLVRTLERVRRDGAATHALMARLVVHDPEIARAALDASAPLLPESVVGRWREILADPEVLLFPRALTGAILSRTPAPGGMQATFTGLRDAARRHLRERGLHRTPRTPPPGPPHTLIEVRPFSPAGLVHAAQEQQGHGLRAFVRGDLLSAERHLEIAAAFNSNLPVIFWNLSRIALARGQRELAVRRIEGALQAARSTKSDLLTSLEREHDSLVSRRPLPTTLVSPVQP